MKFKFEMDSTESYPNSDINGKRVVAQFDEEGLPEILEQVADFLRGCGFILEYNGEIGYFNKDEE